jgi:cytochrome c-type biogenesis protein CcmH
VLTELDPSSENAAQLRTLIDTAEQRAGIPAEARTAASAVSGEGTPGASPGMPAEQDQDQRRASAAVGPGTASEPDAGAGGTASDSSGAASTAIDVSVSLASTIAGRANPGDTVFVYAKAAAGPPMPLAVQRITVADLPAEVRLDDSMAVIPAMKLSSFPQLIVGARVSDSGRATPQSGDLEGETGPVAGGRTATVSVSIDRVRP